MSTEASHPPARWISRYGLIAFAISMAFLATGVRWLWLYQHGQPLDIDEAGYIATALADYSAWTRAGVHGWIAAVVSPSNQAPVTSVVSSVIFMITGPHIIAGFAVPMIAAVLCILATYALGASVGTRNVGIAACALLAVCPVIVNFSRNFHFSMSAALATTLALLSIVRSDRFNKVGWAIVFGLSFGLMPLARTMTIAFMPGVFAAAIMYLAADTEKLRRRTSILIFASVIAAFTAASWLLPNARLVFGYLFDFGYGSRAVEFGSSQSKFGWDAWIAMITAFEADTYLPHFIFVILGFFATLILTVMRLAQCGPRAAGRDLLRSKLFPLCVAVLEFILALTSSRNRGSAFFAPVVPVVLVIACYALFRINNHRIYRTSLAAIMLVVICIAGVPGLDLRTPFAKPHFVNLPVFGTMTISDGRGSVQRYEAFGGYASEDVPEPIPPAVGKAWIELSNSIAAELSATYGSQPLIAFGFRNEIFNVNTLNVSKLLQTGLPFPVIQVEPTVTGNTISGYREWLDSIASPTCALLTANLEHGEFNPPVKTPLMEIAAAEAGFTRGKNWRAPDGRMVTMWARPVLPSNCH